MNNLNQQTYNDNKKIFIEDLFNNFNIILENNNKKEIDSFKEQLIVTINKCYDNENKCSLFSPKSIDGLWDASKDIKLIYEKIINLLINCSKLDKFVYTQTEKYFNEILNYKGYIVFSFVEPIKDFNENYKNIEKKPKEKVEKPKKKKIPAALRNKVWNENISYESKIGNCYVCENKLNFDNFHCGHIISENNGGDIILDNLKPICMLCNTSMGSMNMNDFIDKYGFKKTNYKFDRNSKIGDVIEQLNKLDRKKIINILYENKIISLSELLI